MKTDFFVTGPDAFYNKDSYSHEAVIEELSKKDGPKEITYSYNTENKTYSVAKKIFATLFIPLLIYRIIHAIAGFICMPARFIPKPSKNFYSSYSHSLDSKNLKLKRITIETDGTKIDALIKGTPETFKTGRWTLFSIGNGEIYDHRVIDGSIDPLLQETNSNAIFFNYPGVGQSGLFPHRHASKKAYEAILKFLEEEIKATEIIGYGISIGGGIQAEAIATHEFKENIKYIFVKDRTFSTLSQTATSLMGGYRLFGLLIHLFGWNIDTASSSKKLKHPEIIIQVEGGDEIIKKEASLQQALENLQNKTFITLKRCYPFAYNNNHCRLFSSDEMATLTTKINKCLSDASK